MAVYYLENPACQAGYSRIYPKSDFRVAASPLKDNSTIPRRHSLISIAFTRLIPRAQLQDSDFPDQGIAVNFEKTCRIRLVPSTPMQGPQDVGSLELLQDSPLQAIK
jgi:hypothetical protein